MPDRRLAEQLLERIPPQSHEAEQAALGAMLLEREAIVRGEEVLQPEDFYREAHRWIYRGILDLYRAGEPADLITLGEWLRAHTMTGGAPGGEDNLLSQVGGTLYLTTLMESAPTASGITHYAAIVREKSMQRRLIAVADEIMQEAYLGQKELDDLLRDSEGKIFSLTERVLAGGPMHMPEVYDIARDAIAARKEADAQGFDVGFKTDLRLLNRVLTPIKPGEMVVVAGRPGMGKSALAMQMGLAAAEQGQHGIFFSLEMDQDSLAMRLLTAHGCDAWKANSLLYRTAHQEEVYGAMEGALETLRGLPFKVVDTPQLCANDILHLGRRSKVDGGLDFIIVDYLQLMDANERHGEIYERVRAISRELKQAAKTLKVAVIAISQLSRQVENRTPPRPMMSDLRECVAGDTRLVDARSGRWVAIRDIKPGDQVLGMTPEQKIIQAKVADVWLTGVKPVFTITTQSGRQLTATANHPLFTAKGWKSVEELQPGDCIGTAMRLPDHGEEQEERADLCRLLGYMVGDGTYQKHRSIGFISSDPETFADAVAIVQAHFPEVTPRFKGKEHYQEADFRCLYPNGYGKPYGNPLREWLRELGMIGERDATKRIPEWVFEAGVTGVCQFLAGYCATDGCVKLRVSGKDGKRPIWGVQFDTISRKLAEDLQALLLRIGVVASINDGYLSTKGTTPIYRITISSKSENIARFARMVPVRGKKGVLLAQVMDELPAGETGPGLFGLPLEVSEYVAMRSPWRDQRKSMRRQVCLEWAEKLQDQSLEVWANSDLLWEDIKRIEPAGEAEVWDIRIPACGSFIANGIVAHNSGQLEQDADKILLLYRPGYYGKRALQAAELDEDDTTSTELILAKQRNGPTDAVWTRFDPKRTWFFDLEEE